MRDLTLIDAFGVRDGEVVTLVGAGGKTTLMFALAQEFSRLGKRVVITTTVKMYKKDVGQIGKDTKAYGNAKERNLKARETKIKFEKRVRKAEKSERTLFPNLYKKV